jgi:hypothetical protein
MRLADRDDPLRDEVIAQAPAPERRPVFFSGIARVLALAADTVQPQFADDRVEHDRALRFDHSSTGFVVTREGSGFGDPGGRPAAYPRSASTWAAAVRMVSLVACAGRRHGTISRPR